MILEAPLEQTETGRVPKGEGWFVLNARDVPRWRHEEKGQGTDFEGKHEFPQLGFQLHVLMPGQHGVYHGEVGQEDFLVVSGECLLVIEGEERRLKIWDFVHCPPWTRHVFVGAGEKPCVIVGAGSRVGGFEAVHPVDEAAAKYGASARGDVEPGRGPHPLRAGGVVGLSPRGGCRERRCAPALTLASRSCMTGRRPVAARRATMRTVGAAGFEPRVVYARRS
jgi:hypothetical protein